jgi:hypothetical protein
MPLPDVSALVEFTEPVTQKSPRETSARRAESAPESNVSENNASPQQPLAEPADTTASAPAHESAPHAAAREQPAPRQREIVGYSPMGRPINRVFQNTRTNEPAPRMELQTGLDRTLNLIANAAPGMQPPPKLDLRSPNEDILASLDTDIVLLQDDDESLAQASNVANLKQEMRLYLSEGGDADAFIDAYRDWLQRAYETRAEAQSRMLELLRKGDHEGARRFVEERNAAFAEEGIAPLAVPPVFAPKQ